MRITELVDIAVEQDCLEEFSRKILATKIDKDRAAIDELKALNGFLLMALDRVHEYVDSTDVELEEKGASRDSVLRDARALRSLAMKRLDRYRAYLDY